MSTTGFTTFARVLLSVSLLLGGRLEAQLLRGTVKDDAGTPVSGAVITVVAADGVRLATALSRPDGSYAVRVPTAGMIRIEVKRIGVRATTLGPLPLGSGETRVQDVTVAPISVLQPEVRVVGRSRCSRVQEFTEEAADLWSNARAALDAVKLTEDQQLVAARITRVARDLDRQTYRVVREEARETFTYGEKPFIAAAVEELSKQGYVRREGNGFRYFSPDAGVILSDQFLAEHCFRVVNGTGTDSSNVGLAFAPVAGRDTPDISGTLWLNGSTQELQSLVFLFENAPPPHERGQAGGTLHFQRLKDGVWIVDRYTLRWPRFAGRTRGDPTSFAIVYGGAGGVTSYREEGGIATLLEPTELGFGSLRGSILDGDIAAPVPGAYLNIWRRGSLQARVAADANGDFHADTLPPGIYHVEAGTPRLDSLGTMGRSTEFRLHANDAPSLELTLPTEDALWQAICPDVPRAPDRGLLRVHVLDAGGGDAASQIPLRVSWEGSTRTESVSGVTDAAGVWTTCRVPTEARLTVEVLSGERVLVRGGITIAAGAIVVLPLTIPLVRSGA